MPFIVLATNQALFARARQLTPFPPFRDSLPEEKPPTIATVAAFPIWWFMVSDDYHHRRHHILTISKFISVSGRDGVNIGEGVRVHAQVLDEIIY